MFSFEQRPKLLLTLDRYSFDVLVIGGGITGAGIALDAAMRGLSVALVEMQDFAAGTSSRSTKLVHGGLRYLKQLDVGVVAEVGREREIVYENAVHVTTPEKMLLPLYENGSYSPFTTSVALKIYDRLARVKKEERRKMLNAKETIACEPLLKREGLLGAGYYVEYRTDDARLTIEVLKKAVENKAICLNYAKVTDFIYEGEKIAGAHVRDEITGVTIEIHATQVVNATGPWVDEIRTLDGLHDTKQLRLTKGVHIVFDETVFPLKQAIYFDAPDGRMIFAIPRDGKTYVGTTDTFYEANPQHPVATTEDVHYLLDAIHFMFPDVPISLQDVESSWAGVRPLIWEEGKKPSEISRKDEIWIASSGLMSIAGGKLTGYRQMAEDVVDKIVKIHRFKHAEGCSTKEQSLSGAVGLNSKNFENYIKYKAKEGESLGLTYEESKELVAKYGTNVETIFMYVKALQQESSFLPITLHAALLYALKYEMIYTPVDFFIRRTGMLYFDITKVEQYKEAVLEIMAKTIGYTAEQYKWYTRQLDDFIEDAKYPKKG